MRELKGALCALCALRPAAPGCWLRRTLAPLLLPACLPACCPHSLAVSSLHCLPLATLRPRAAPTLEVFFARQPPGTGIKAHTDYVNFVQTTHLGLIVPEGDCWMKVSGWGCACFRWVVARCALAALRRACAARRLRAHRRFPPAPSPLAQVGEHVRNWAVGKVMVCDTR